MANLKILILGIMLMLMSCGLAVAQDQEAPEREKTKEFAQKQDQLDRELGVTADQRKLLDEIKKQHRQERKALFAQMKTKMAELHNQLEKPELDLTQIYKIHGEIKAVQARILDARLQRVLDIRKVLNPEQSKQFLKRFTQMHESQEHRRGREKPEF